MKQAFILSLSLWVLSLTLHAQNDIEGSKDHPLIPRYPGSFIIYYDKTEDASYNFTLGPLIKHSPDEDYKLTDTKIIKGDLTRIQYLVNEANIVKVVDFYERTLQANGFIISAVTRSSKPMGIAGRNWTLAAYQNLPAKEKSNIAGTKSGEDKRYYLAGSIERQKNKAYFTIIINEFEEGKIFIHTDIIGSEFYPVKKEILTAEEINQHMIEYGYAAITGITFKANTAEILDISKPAIDEVARYLKENDDVTLYIVGHTGMTGKFDFLMALSKSMADALVKILTDRYNISPNRLTAEGVGPLSPITTNQNVEGRNFNQRIELVLRIY